MKRDYLQDRILKRAGLWWEDINFEATNLRPGSSSPGFHSIAGTPIFGLFFDGNVTTEELHGGGEILHNYAEGSDFSYHAHLSPSTDNPGNIKFFIDYMLKNVNGVFGSEETISKVIPASGVAWTHQAAVLGIVPGLGIKLGAHFLFRIYRVPSDPEDTYPDDVLLMSTGVHYRINTPGSRQEFLK